LTLSRVFVATLSVTPFPHFAFQNPLSHTLSSDRRPPSSLLLNPCCLLPATYYSPIRLSAFPSAVLRPPSSSILATYHSPIRLSAFPSAVLRPPSSSILATYHSPIR